MTDTRWNLLIYAIAGNREEHQHIRVAVREMHAALTTDRCRIVVQVGASAGTTRHWISRDEVRTEELHAPTDTSRAKSLTDFLDAAHRASPAEATALVLWAHGSGLDYVHDYPHKSGGGLGGGPRAGERGGAEDAQSRARPEAVHLFGAGGAAASSLWPPLGRPRHEEPPRDAPADSPDSYGCRWGPDPKSGRYLTNITLKNAIRASAQERVAVLAFNACWMATLEVEYELRNVSEVQVGSQVYAKPWPYDAIVTALSSDPDQSAEQLGHGIVSTVRDEIARGNRRDAVSALRSGAAMTELAAAFEPYARRVTTLIETDWPGVLRAVATEAQRIDDPYQVDFASLISVLGRRDREARLAASVVASRLESMIIANAADSSHPGVRGLSIFCPKSTHVDLAAAYEKTEFRTHAWAEFLVRFQQRAASHLAAPPHVEPYLT